MKKYLLPLAIAGVVALQACNQQSTEPPAGSAAPAAPAGVSLETSEQRLSYGIAYGLGQRMGADSVPLDIDAFAAGLRDGIEGGEPKMSREEIQAEMTAYQEKMASEQQAAQAALAEANEAAAKIYLAENASREGVTVTDTGLQYEILEAGDGPMPGPEDTVEVNYRGTLIDGTEFDSSYQRGQTVTFGVGQVIAGWTEALQKMPVGSKWRLTIPADLAYGAGGAGQVIGPNAALVFEVELVSIPSQEEAAGEEGAEQPAAESTAEG
jgi:FKBP-type peptidyl-prolyl cis-trans isomerase